MNLLREQYQKEIVQKLKKELSLDNGMAVPTLAKVVINAGVGEAVTDKSVLEKMSEDLAIISGQKPIITKSRSAISNFNIRVGDEIGAKVTLRGKRMWDFIEKLIGVVLPRVKDFRGVSRGSFDGQGNYSLGIDEHTVFPEIDPNKVDKLRSLQVIIVTTAQDNEGGMKLLEMLGMPFAKESEARMLEKIEEQEEQSKEALSAAKAKKVVQGKSTEDSESE